MKSRLEKEKGCIQFNFQSCWSNIKFCLCKHTAVHICCIKFIPVIHSVFTCSSKLVKGGFLYGSPELLCVERWGLERNTVGRGMAGRHCCDGERKRSVGFSFDLDASLWAERQVSFCKTLNLTLHDTHFYIMIKNPIQINLMFSIV